MTFLGFPDSVSIFSRGGEDGLAVYGVPVSGVRYMTQMSKMLEHLTRKTHT